MPGASKPPCYLPGIFIVTARAFPTWSCVRPRQRSKEAQNIEPRQDIPNYDLSTQSAHWISESMLTDRSPKVSAAIDQQSQRRTLIHRQVLLDFVNRLVRQDDVDAHT